MIIVISLGAVITALTYLFGFILIVYLIEIIRNSLNEILTFLNINIPQISNFNILLFILILVGAITVLKTKNDFKTHENENNEMVYRKDWQKLFDIVNIVMIYPIFTFYENINIIDTKYKVFMFAYAVIFLIVFTFSHYYVYINKKSSTFDRICSSLYGILTVFASIFIGLLIFCIYSFVIYLYNFSNMKNIIIYIFYYAFLIFPTIIFSMIFFPSSSKNQKLKTIILDHILLIFLSLILGFSPFYNIFIKNGSIYSIHSLILLDIVLILVVSIILLPIRIKKCNNGA